MHEEERACLQYPPYLSCSSRGAGRTPESRLTCPAPRSPLMRPSNPASDRTPERSFGWQSWKQGH
jgi:hypothetical protein